jgi:outer membrane protein
LSIDAITSYADDIYKDAERNLPQVRLAEYQLKGMEKGLAVARGGRSPKVSLNASYGSGYSDARSRYGNDTARILTTPIGFLASDPSQLVVYKHPTQYTMSYPFSNQMRDNASTAISFSVSIPIFNGWMINTNISNAKINVLNSKYQLDYTKKQLYKDIQQALTDAIAAYRQYIASDKAVASMQESFRNIQQKYDVGMVNFVDYSTSKNQLTLAQSQMLQAKYSYIFKTKVLEFYKGGQVKM